MSTEPRIMTAERQKALNRVRRRVSALVFLAVAEHGVFGLIVVSSNLIDEPGRRSDAIGLLIMSGIVSTLAYVGVRLILQAKLLSLWILPAVAIPLLGALWVLR